MFRYGRIKVLYPSYFLFIVASVASVFAQNGWSLILSRALIGLFQGGIYVPAMAMAVEIVGPKHRAFCTNIVWCIWPVTLYLLSLQSWLMSDWRKLTLVTSAPYVVIMLGAW